MFYCEDFRILRFSREISSSFIYATSYLKYMYRKIFSNAIGLIFHDIVQESNFISKFRIMKLYSIKFYNLMHQIRLYRITCTKYSLYSSIFFLTGGAQKYKECFMRETNVNRFPVMLTQKN